jgi:hypothetical protein
MIGRSRRARSTVRDRDQRPLVELAELDPAAIVDRRDRRVAPRSAHSTCQGTRFE